MKLEKPKPPCPCGETDFESCCAKYIQQQHAAPTAEALMRSRYTAYVLGDEHYLRNTWHVSTRPSEPISVPDEPIKSLSLAVISHQWVVGSTTAIVEFIAKYKLNGRAYRLHEISHFVHEGQWFYVDGTYPEDNK